MRQQKIFYKKPKFALKCYNNGSAGTNESFGSLSAMFYFPNGGVNPPRSIYA
jgi:hypothetical protein